MIYVFLNVSDGHCSIKSSNRLDTIKKSSSNYITIFKIIITSTTDHTLTNYLSALLNCSNHQKQLAKIPTEYSLNIIQSNETNKRSNEDIKVNPFI